MHWFQFRKRSTESQPEDTAETPAKAQKPTGRSLPPHLKRIVEERGSRNHPAHTLSPDERLARLQRRRMGMVYDIEQGELASEPDNPWQHRIELLTEALGTVDDDLKLALQHERSPWHPVPATPVTDIVIDTGDAAAVSFAIGGNPFRYAEEIDWAERGHTLARPELEQVEGDITTLVPADTPEALRDPLARHLERSLFVFAADLRDRQLDDESLPDHPTLADMAKPCPDCGGWADWRGRCEACTIRKARQQELKREEKRLLSERAREAEERHRLVERLPVARRRLADLDAEIAELERSQGKN